MATETRKVLTQGSPPATTLVTIYTTPAATQAVVSTLYVCNTNAFPSNFRISVAVAGAADDISQYIYYDVAIPANETFAATTGMTLNTTDELRMYASNTNVCITVFGVEIT